MWRVTRLWLPAGFLIAGGACRDGKSTDREVGELVEGSNFRRRGGCIERASPLADDVLIAPDIAVEEILLVVRGEHTTALTWPDGEPTEIKLTVHEAQAFMVTSRDEPNYGPNGPVLCSDRVVVNTRARLATSDGRFDVDIPELQLEVLDGKWMVGSSGGLPKDTLRGSYAATAASVNECLRDTVVGVSLSISDSRFRGELSNVVGDVPCGRDDPLEGVTERTGARW